MPATHSRAMIEVRPRLNGRRSKRKETSMATLERTKDEVAAGTSPDLLYYEEPSASHAETTPAGAGWLLFCVIVLALAGVWAIVEGILAVTSSKIYVGDATFVFSD